MFGREGGGVQGFIGIIIGVQGKKRVYRFFFGWGGVLGFIGIIIGVQGKK